MITFLYDTNNNLITNLVNSAILNPDIKHIKNRLLSGEYHTQTIGEVVSVINVTCYTDEIQKNKIDNIYVIGEPIKLVKRDKYYVGLIDNKSDWKEFAIGLYETSFKIVVQSEGII